MRSLAILSLILTQWLIPTRGSAASLEQTLAAMDKVAASFGNMTAKLTKISYTAVVKVSSQETGSVRMKRTGRTTSMVTEFAEPDPRTVFFEKPKLQMYYPKMQTVQVYDLGKQRSLVDQFLLLGFGSSSQELKKSYKITAAGEDTIGGEPTTRLELIPSTPSVLEHLSKAELWISAAGYPVQQKFLQPSGDYTLITYKGLQLNPGLPAGSFAPKFPKGVKYEYPQK